jgi:FixJ family two-component response regulator
MTQPFVFVVDDDQAVRDGLTMLCEAAGLQVKAYESAESFLSELELAQWGCLVLDVRMKGMSGIQLHEELIHREFHLPVIFLTGHGDIPMSVRAIKAGAVDFLTKPVSGAELLDRIIDVLDGQRDLYEQHEEIKAHKRRLGELTPRESEVLMLALAGNNNKTIGKQLQISFRTVEIHRSRILRKMGVANMLELARLSAELGVSAMPSGGDRKVKPQNA